MLTRIQWFILLIFVLVSIAVVAVTYYGKSWWVKSEALSQAELLTRWSQNSVDREILHPLGRQAGLPQVEEPGYWLIHFWASWCGPCVEELPTLQQVCERMAPRLRIVAISEDVDRPTMEQFLKDHHLNKLPNCPWGWVFDEKHQWQKTFGIEKLPETFLFGSDGRLFRQISGGQDWLNPEILNFLTQWVQSSN